jgi:hypothetical protein
MICEKAKPESKEFYEIGFVKQKADNAITKERLESRCIKSWNPILFQLGGGTAS